MIHASNDRQNLKWTTIINGSLCTIVYHLWINVMRIMLTYTLYTIHVLLLPLFASLAMPPPFSVTPLSPKMRPPPPAMTIPYIPLLYCASTNDLAATTPLVVTALSHNQFSTFNLCNKHVQI